MKGKVKKLTRREQILRIIHDSEIDIESQSSDGTIVTHPARYNAVIACGQKLLESGLCKKGQVFLYTPQSGDMMNAYLEICGTLKATGIVRQVDDLGRVVIPKEIRRNLGIKEGDNLEIYIDEDGGIVYHKYNGNQVKLLV